MLVQHPKPPQNYPHHRSFWFGDKVQLAGKRAVSFYSPLYSRTKGTEETEDTIYYYNDQVRHVRFLACESSGNIATIRTQLLWEMDTSTPVLDEIRDMRLLALGGGEYFMDVIFTVKASYGDVAFVSDAVHYAWPYIRMNRTFSVEGGGTITNSAGQINQKGTNMKEAVWVDYSSTVKGTTEGLAVFSHPDNPQPHKWLTRDYGCFGPRRIDARSGRRFTLKQGESLKRRIGVLVHSGGVKTGRVAERYQAYVQGTLFPGSQSK
jgi:hypothetical protein